LVTRNSLNILQSNFVAFMIAFWLLGNRHNYIRH
jgi:hypothetical protein